MGRACPCRAEQQHVDLHADCRAVLGLAARPGPVYMHMKGKEKFGSFL